VDLGCGDFKCGKYIYDDLNIKYYGYDTYNKIIDHHKKSEYDDRYTFIHLDFFGNKEQLVPADLCILKDVLQHWELNDIYTFLDYLTETKKYKYILICNCDQQYKDNTTISTANFFPLKKYNPVIIYTYHTKKVSLIST